MDRYAAAFQLALGEVRRLAALSKDEADESYEPLKKKIYEILRRGEADTNVVVNEAMAWLRQRSQIMQSTKRLGKSRQY